MRNFIRSIKMIALSALLAGAAGCTQSSAVDRDFGNSVRHVMRSQTLDPLAAVAPDREAVDHGDGQRIEAVMEAYREDVSKPADIGQDIVIQVGN